MGHTVALIPARGGSKRVPGKNIRPICGQPLIAYAIQSAVDSGCFEKVLVSSDDTETLEIAASMGADCIHRPDEFAHDTSPDIDWVTHALKAVGTTPAFDTFSILRPTSPFRTAETIQRAFSEWQVANAVSNGTSQVKYSSLRAVQLVSQHPGKMWQKRGSELVPLMIQPLEQPFHDSQMAALPPVYVQNASLEIAWVKTVEETSTISGSRVLPFLTIGHEGFDVNCEIDWTIAQILSQRGEAPLSQVRT